MLSNGKYRLVDLFVATIRISLTHCNTWHSFHGEPPVDWCINKVSLSQPTVASRGTCADGNTTTAATPNSCGRAAVVRLGQGSQALLVTAKVSSDVSCSTTNFAREACCGWVTHSWFLSLCFLITFLVQWTDVCSTQRTEDNRCCVFPFVFNGASFNSCTTVNASRKWCATTANYDRDKQRGCCDGMTFDTTFGRRDTRLISFLISSVCARFMQVLDCLQPPLFFQREDLERRNQRARAQARRGWGWGGDKVKKRLSTSL